MYLFVAHVLTCMLVFCNGFSAVDTSDVCPEGYEVGYDGGCYLFETNAVAWSIARNNCTDTPDSDLLVINNSDELEYIKHRITSGIWWIGFTDLSVEGTWEWINCTGLFNQSLWAPNQPNNGIEDCGAYQAVPQKLADYQCSREYKFICEISTKGFSDDDTNARNVAATKVNDTIAHVTWDVSQYNCDVIGYRVYYEHYGNSQTNGSVQIDGGNSTEVYLPLTPDMWWQIYVAAMKTDHQELDLVGPASVWLGYTDVSVEGSWKWVDCGDTNDWQSTLWAPGEPAEPDDCATLQGNTGHLRGQICDQRFLFICKVSPKDFTKEDTKPSNLTAIAVTSFSVEVTWDVSMFACDVIGYRVYYNSTSDKDNQDWVFINGGDVSSVILSGLAKETDYSIGVAALRTVEELEQIGPVAVTTPWGCPSGFEEGYGNRSCYWFQSEERDMWYSHRNWCKSYGSDLLIIDSPNELEYILNRTESIAPNETWWIGYTDVSVEGSWKWVDCGDTNDWQSTDWAPGEPAESDDCATLQGNTGHLRGQICDQRFLFICEVSPKDFTKEDTKPSNLTAIALTSFSVEVTWDVSMFACDVIGYRVYYNSTSDKDNQDWVFINGGDVSSMVLSGLAKETDYTIGVAALTTVEELEQTGPVAVTTPWGCPSGFEEGPTNHSCYWFQSEERDMWYSHRNWCKSYGSDLLIIDSPDELEYILNRTESIAPNETWWIGYTDVSVEGSWKWVDCGDTNDWQSTLWAPGEPAEPDDCATMQGNTGHLRGQICDQRFLFICEVSPKDFTKEDTKPSNLTAIAVTSFSVEVTWDVSMFACDVIGYRVYYSSTSDKDNLDWVFINGGDVSSVILSGLAKETDYSIGVAALTTVEELEQIGPVDITTPWGCPSGFEEGPGDHSCYFFYNGTDTWASARGRCRGIEDGDIVIVDDEDELKYLVRRMEEVNPGQMWWIGYYDVSVEGVWRWVDCQPTVDWQKPLWPGEEPMVGTGDCGYLVGVQGDGEAEIRPAVCDDRKFFICEVVDNRVFPTDANARNVAAIEPTPDSFLVTWDTSPDNCDVIGYTVYYQKESPSAMEEFLMVNGGNISRVEVTVPMVQENTVYSVTVAALNTVTVLERVGPASVTLNPGEPVSTPAYSSSDAVLFIVFDQTVGWFTSMMQVQLATGIANVLNRYTPNQQRDTFAEFGTSDVIFISIFNTGSDLHIVTWVRDVTSSEPGVPLDPNKVLSALSAEQTYFEDFMGPTFQYAVSLAPSLTPTTTAAPTGGGIDEWLIAVIAVGALLVLIVLGSIVFKCGSKHKKTDRRIDLHNEYAGGSVYERFTPTSFSSDGTWNPAFQPMQEVERDNSITSL
ncbi:uncharacterized protein [Asterias amurensis]|uniref:uncharacterized protein isoform X2 n=1 Tax=Asterias amurensis TaxID=7602 RepID=UPI003AB3D655